MDILEKTREMCEGYGSLLYLTKFGSHLYGTNTPESDTDYKGLFLPSLENLVLQEKCNVLSYQTNSSNSKNNKEDMDVQLWSLQYWLSLLRKGDTNAIDLLYSFTNLEAVVWQDSIKMIPIFKNADKFINIKNSKAYISYAYHQAKKYGIKGSRMGILSEILIYTKERQDQLRLQLLDQAGVLFDDILAKFKHDSYCFLKEDKTGKYLYILGRGYHEKIKIDEMIERMETEYNKYGTRVEQAKNNEGVDWKAVSHAVRCLIQMKQLATYGKIHYPLEEAHDITKIKKGMVPWSEVQVMIENGLADVDILLQYVKPNNKINEFHKNYILDTYTT